MVRSRSTLPRRAVQLAGVAALVALSATPARAAYVLEDGYAVTRACDPVRNDPAMFFLQNAGPEMRQRHRGHAVARSASGSRAKYAGSLRLGRIEPFVAQAQAAALQSEGCTQSEAQAVANFAFLDEIEVKAWGLAEGSPVTYTVDIDLPVRIQGLGTRCPLNAEFQALATLADQRAEWRQNGPYWGEQRLTLQYTGLVGQTMTLSLSTTALASAVRYGGDNECVHNLAALTEGARIRLAADVVGANTVSVNGVNYGNTD